MRITVKIPMKHDQLTPSALPRAFGCGALHSPAFRHSGIAIFLLFLCSGAFAQTGDARRLRAERVGWARLRTPDDVWMRHSTGDGTLMRFLRENTNLNIDPTWYVADIEKLDELCRYPLLFAQGLHYVRGENARANMAEYVRRGGFILIDVCINASLNPDCDVRLDQNIRFLSTILPEARIVPVPPEHEIYRCFFQIPGGIPPHTYFNNVYSGKLAKHGLYAVMIGQRMAGLISLCGLQCGWDRMIAPPNHDVACMRMLVNIYIYAMMQGG